MARDESQQQPDESAGSENTAPITITTSDPAIESSVEHASDWRIRPDSTLNLETTQVHEPNPLYVVGVRKVVHQDQESRSGGQGQKGGKSGDKSNQSDKKGEEEQAGKKGGQDEDGGDGAKDEGPKQNNGKEGGQKKGNQWGETKGQKGGDQKEKKGGQEDGGNERDQGQAKSRSEDERKAGSAQQTGRHQQKQPSMMKSLLMTAGIALLAGLVGAFGYSYVAGSKSDSSASDQSQSKGGASSKGGSDSKKKSNAEKGSGGDEDQESGNGTSSQSSNSKPNTQFATAHEVDILKNQIMGLIERVGSLTGRVDRMTRVKDEMPALLQTLQIEMSETARKLADVASLHAKVGDHDNRLQTLQAEIKFLRTRLESVTSGEAQGLASNGPLPGQDAGVSLPLPNTRTEGPTMELGIQLLEKGEYAEARTVFDRLQSTQPSDARVWYFGALAVGLVSGDWDDEAKELAEKGVERERAGTPPAAQIDASLATPTPIKGGLWLSALRRRSLGANRTP